MKTRFAQEKAFKAITQRIFPNQSATFAKCYNWLMCREELTPGAKLLYSRLVQCAGIKNHARVKQSTLALELGLGLRQVKRYIAELAYFHLIEIQQLGLNKANLYYFLQHPWMTQTDKEKQPQTNVKKEDVESVEVTYVALPEVSDPTPQEVTDLTCQEMPDPTPPLNRSSEKIPLKEHTLKKERVCVLNGEVSAYSKQEWFYYAKEQKNVHSPQALADKLAKSKDNDHLMKEFLDNQTQQKQKQEKQIQEQKQQDLKLEKTKQELISFYLSQTEPLAAWQIQFLHDHGHLLSNRQVC